MSQETLLKELLTKVDQLLIESKEQKNSMRRLKARVTELNATTNKFALAAGITSPDVSTSKEERKELIWRLSPKQHAYLQLILLDFKHTDIMARFNVTLNGSSSVIRKLCRDLKVNDKTQIKLQYTALFKELNAKEYKEHAQISKSWGEKYGNLSYEQCVEHDPYHEVITKRYRKPNGLGRIYEQVKT